MLVSVVVGVGLGRRCLSYFRVSLRVRVGVGVAVSFGVRVRVVC